MKRIKNIFKIMAILPVILFLFSCDNTLNDSETSTSILLVAKITGYTDTGDDADLLQSDIYEETSNTVVADLVSATLEARLQEPETLGPGSSYMSSILVDHYEVSYTAVDPSGSSVPVTFTGYLSTIIAIDSSIDVSFVIVREVAKVNSPLFDLRGTISILQVTASITFYGHDVLDPDKEVQATAYLTIYFADYAD